MQCSQPLKSLVLRPIALVSLLWALSSPFAHSQVTFFSPPSFPCYSGAFVLADFNLDGKEDVVCAATGNVFLGNGAGGFTGAGNLNLAGSALVVGDFNGDGKPDVATGVGFDLEVFIGNGDGTFQAAKIQDVGVQATLFTAADINGDGKVDLLGTGNGDLFVFLGNGDGTFQSGVSYPLPDQTGPALTGDFNGDGQLDVAVAGGNIQVLLGNSDGTFQSPIIGAALPCCVVAMTDADFNGDGKLDLAISDGTQSSPATAIFLGTGAGTFTMGQALPTGGGSVAVGDLNGDSKPDLVALGGFCAEVFLGNGDGTFTQGNCYFQVTSQTNNEALYDFNRDGKLDLATNLGLLFGNGDGTLQGTPAIPVSGTAGVEADFNGDGKPDIAEVSSSELDILLNNSDANLTLANSYSLSAPGYAIETSDLNGDGNLDLLVSTVDSSYSWGLNAFLGNGDGTVTGPIVTTGGTGSYPDKPAISIADFNGDGKPDVVVVQGYSGASSLSILLGNGDGTFGSPVTYFAGSNTTAVTTADFNNDGNIDVAVSSASGIGLFLGKGDGTFQTATFFTTGVDPASALTTADVNNDGNIDLIPSNNLGPQVLLGNGNGTFTALNAICCAGGTVIPVDLNGDGKLDFVTSAPSAISILLGNGDGTFGAVDTVESFDTFLDFETEQYAVAADFNGDGLPDIAFGLTLGGGGIGGGGVVFLLQTPPGPDFQISSTLLSPAIVTAGAAAASTVTVAPLVGFNGAVALSCSGLPSGLSCSFNPPSVAGGSGISVLTVTTATTTPSGGYGVTIVGTSGSLTHTTSVTLNVETAPTKDFQVAATAFSPATVTPGGSAMSTVTISPINGFASTVTLSCSGLPTGASCNFSASSIANGSGTSTLTLVTAASTTPGTYPVIVTGTAGTIVNTLPVAITVQAPAFTIAAASGSPTSATINAGQTATFNLDVTPSATFSGTVNLSCSITPTASPAPVCTVPSSVSVTAGMAASVEVTVSTTAPGAAGTVARGNFPPGAFPIAWTAFLFASLSLLVANRKCWSAAAAPALLLAFISLAGCGGSSSSSTSSGSPGTPANTYTATVTATSGSSTGKTTLTVIVQ
jgi:hypothetical protein